MSQINEHDVVIVGAGPAGDRAATLAAAEGLDVAQVEREKVGGECAYWGCMPSKALLRPGELLAETRRVPGVPSGELNVNEILARRDEVIYGLDDGSHAERQVGRGITLYRGHGRLDGERRVQVESSDAQTLELRARRAVIISVGSAAQLPPVPGLAELSPWTNREATTATKVPASLLVLGGGPVGCELAQAWSSLGSAVTLLEAGGQLLPDIEPFAAELVTRSLREQGVDVRTATVATGAGRDDRGRFTLSVDSGKPLSADELLVCTGRSPRTDDLGLETVDLAAGRLIEVDAKMRVPHHDSWLYAIGDVNGRALLTHAGKYQAQVAVANIMNRPARATWDGPLSPQVIFTEPQVAAVGHTLEQALADGIAARAVDADPGATPGASFIGKGGASGARIVVDEAREVMIGATFVGPELAESLQAATFAVVAEIPLARLSHAMPAYPTRSEVWLELLADWRP
jgi:pyruvate/2-oxoglutarate dehydrogenase complex dihydrolipoamide dehydrogenase (E3) component